MFSSLCTSSTVIRTRLPLLVNCSRQSSMAPTGSVSDELPLIPNPVPAIETLNPFFNTSEVLSQAFFNRSASPSRRFMVEFRLMKMMIRFVMKLYLLTIFFLLQITSHFVSLKPNVLTRLKELAYSRQLITVIF